MEDKKILSLIISGIEDKEGNKDGKPWRVRNVTTADGTRYSYFHPSKRDKSGNWVGWLDSDPFLDSLVVGATVKCVVEDRQKGEYVNHYLSPVRQIDLQEERIATCEKEIASLKKAVAGLSAPSAKAAEDVFGPPDDNGVNIEDVPF